MSIELATAFLSEIRRFPPNGSDQAACLVIPNRDRRSVTHADQIFENAPAGREFKI